TLNPPFGPSVFSYTATVPNGTNSVDVSATTSDSNASFTINGSTNATVALTVGDNTISIVVTAEDGTTTLTYTIVVTRAPLSTGPAACNGGSAGDFPCSGISLKKQVSLETMGGTLGNDIWGWSDALTGNEYALMGMTNGTAFVDITIPEVPVFLGRLPTQTVESLWRDIKVYQDHAYIVADNAGAHGMQVFDLTRLRGLVAPQTFSADAVYSDFGEAHNVAINENTGFAYAVGTDTCGGLHIIDIRTPINPMMAGCYSLTNTHDTQCVIYQGLDADHPNNPEICVSSNGDHVEIVDVTNKTAPVRISFTMYPESGFAHQGWLTEDHRFFLMGDEADEFSFSVPTRIHVFDVSDLDAPMYVFAYEAATAAIDHNLYVLGNRVFQASYTSGLRVLEFADLANKQLMEIAFFDTFPASDATDFSGAWSVYPYLPSGMIIVSDRSNGLFILSLQ
ncbi:MAG: choice-of-anchor B family protein, partial [Proteobacteria bacterium]|nr:choice-of-anchor B family protein [Pseudomonadota bacterium]